MLDVMNNFLMSNKIKHIRFCGEKNRKKSPMIVTLSPQRMNLQSRVTIQPQSPIHFGRKQDKEKPLANSRTSPNCHSILKTSSLALGTRQELGRG